MKIGYLVLLISLLSVPLCGLAQRFQKIGEDSIHLPKVSKSPISLNSVTIKIEAGIMNEPLQFQSFPNNYSRIFIEPTIAICGIKFNSNMMLSTEDLLMGKNMNMFNFGIDRSSVQAKLLELARKSDYFKRLDSLQGVADNLISSKNVIDGKLQSGSYQHEVEIAKATLAKAESDSLYGASRRYDVQRSKLIVDDHQKTLILWDSISTQLNKISKSINLISNLVNNGIPSNEVTTEGLGNYINTNGKKHLYNNSEIIKRNSQLNRQMKRLSFLQNTRSLQFMDFSPRHSELALQGISIRGLGFEWGNGKVYMGFSSGYLNTFKSNNSFIAPKEWLLSGQAGVGNLDGAYGGLFFMKAHYIDSTRESRSKYLENQIVGIQGGIKIAKSHSIKFEKLWSNTNPVKNEGIIHPNSEKSLISDQKNSSVTVVYVGFIERTNTSIEVNFSSCQPFFFAIGNPFLRQDSRRYDVKIEEKLFRNKLSLMASAKQTHDNISGMKSSATSYKEYVGGFGYRFKKVMIKTESRHVYTDNSAVGRVSTTKILSNTITWYSKLPFCANSLVFNINLFTVDMVNNLNSNFQVYNLVNTVMLSNGATVSLNAAMRHSSKKLERQVDSSNSFSVGLCIQKRFTKRATGKLGFEFQNNLNHEYRNSMNLGVTYSFSNRIQGGTAAQVQFIEYTSLPMQFRISGNINLIIKLLNSKSNGK